MLGRLIILELFLLLGVSNAYANDPLQPYPIKSDLAFVVRSLLPDHLSLSEQAARQTERSKAAQNLKGWEHFYALAVREGLDPQYVKRIIRDPRMPNKTPVLFSATPSEPTNIYSRRLNIAEYNNALNFYREHAKYFKEAEHVYQVPQSVILSILQIETQCGRNTGRSIIFHRLARLASASAPDNVRLSFERRGGPRSNSTLETFRERGLWLEESFLPHSLATIILAEKQSVHPLEILGSSAGAMGLPQFLPGNFFMYAVDGNNDGVLDLHQPADAILSVAKYLHEHGWTKLDSDEKTQREIVWHYNRSEPYITTVLAMAKRLESDILRHNEQERTSNNAIAAKL